MFVRKEFKVMDELSITKIFSSINYMHLQCFCSEHNASYYGHAEPRREI